MKLLLWRYFHEGIWFSKNGHKAYIRGEKPLLLWDDDTILEPTIKHHIAHQRPCYTMEFVMFYRKKGIYR